MRRTLKVLGMALVVAVALSVLGASPTMAHQFTSTVEDTVLAAEGGTQELTINSGKLAFQCQAAHFEGTQANTTADQLTLGVEYTGGSNGKCDSSSGKENTEVDAAGCHYHFDSDTTEGNPTEAETTTEEEHANVVLICPEEVLRLTGTLKITLPVQAIDHAVHYDNEGKNFRITVTAHEIEWTCSNSPFACTLGAGGTSGTDGTYTGTALVRGFEYEGGDTTEIPGSYERGDQVDISVD